MNELTHKPQLLLHLICLFLVVSTAQGDGNAQGTDLQAVIQKHQQAQPAPEFSWQDITSKPSLKQVSLSPDGLLVAYLLREKQGFSLWLMDTQNQQSRQLLHSAILERVYWAKNSQRLYLYTPDSMAYVDLAGAESRPEMFYRFDARQHEAFYALDQSSDGHILITREVKKHGQNTEYQLLRIATDGTEQVLFSDAKQVYDHLFDAAGELAFVRQAGTDRHHIYRLVGEEKQLVFTAMVVDRIRMVDFDEQRNELLLVGYHDADLISLHAVNISTGSSRVVHQDPEQLADLSGLLLDAQSSEVLAVNYFTDRQKTYAVHPKMTAGVEKINQALTGSLTIQASLAAPVWLVRQSAADLGHSHYHLYDVDQQLLVPVLTEQRALHARLGSEQLSAAIPVSYTASDGMLLHGYVVLPKGMDLREVPLLTYVHGGPFNRMHGGHSPWQYLVNQGYAIFFPNFRASKGYGMSYMTAGKAQFSGRVQQDIVDGIEYLMGEGISQPGKLGVLGHSFGGYSVLALLSHYPDMFRAGFASAAPTELISTLFKMDQKDINRYDGIPLLAAMSVLMLDPDDPAQKQQMLAQSPGAHWQNISKPLFIWAGALDQRVPIIDVKDHASKLKQAGHAVELLIDQQTGHNFAADDLIGQQAFRFLVEDFFARHFEKSRPKASADTEKYVKRFKVY